jgi:hypothetical protein
VVRVIVLKSFVCHGVAAAEEDGIGVKSGAAVELGVRIGRGLGKTVYVGGNVGGGTGVGGFPSTTKRLLTANCSPTKICTS